MAPVAALARATAFAGPLFLRVRRLAPCAAAPRRNSLFSGLHTADEPPPPAQPPASGKGAEPGPPLPWRAAEAEIVRDIEPVVQLIKDILHSDRYADGECLTSKDENIIIEKLLAYHPRVDDKIGCGLDAIMVDRHPQFRKSRCLFVVRTDGVWIDFSYQKCLRAYIREKYPSHAERFIREHFKRT
ncbi:protein DCL homolog, chloroplastic [Oryza brachyantha]|uniref:DCL protein n=1 Tax=Oryza brachyantha TaxID=4533 RepID=J3MS31_ORYBR|nr:protein DCL homolog, chloroplastic [Oryza brachyantha]XP_015695461.1 protein DCL homolog, chloroplastic [Oryza brachyantha]